jgi:hypothetical protein
MAECANSAEHIDTMFVRKEQINNKYIGLEALLERLQQGEGTVENLSCPTNPLKILLQERA